MQPFIIEIHNPEERSEEKYFRAVSILQKALHFKPVKVSLKEESPIPAVRDRLAEIESSMDTRFYEAFKEIVTTWIGLETLQKAKGDNLPFKVNGSIVINPKTGKPLTKGEWKIIEDDLKRVINWLFGDTQDALVKEAIALGKILATMPLETPLKKIKYRTTSVDDLYLRNTLSFAEENTAAYITAVKSNLKKDIKTTIIEAQKNKMGSRELESILFDKFASRNRDFRMIAETEFNTNAVNGHLLTILERSGKKYTYVKGVSNTNACKFCKENINNQIFVLLPEAPSSGLDVKKIEGKERTVIWPGKNNVGRNKANWWDAVPAHPHCACWFTETEAADKYAKYFDRLHTKMEALKSV